MNQPKLLNSVVSALKLTVGSYASSATPAILFWIYTIFYGFAAATSRIKEGGEVLWWFPLILFVAGWFLHLCAGVSYRWVLKLLWNTPPQWLWLQPGVIRATRSYCVTVISSFPLAVYFCYLISPIILTSSGNYLDDTLDALPEVMLRFSWVWVLSAIFCYQFLTVPVVTYKRVSRRRHAN